MCTFRHLSFVFTFLAMLITSFSAAVAVVVDGDNSDVSAAVVVVVDSVDLTTGECAGKLEYEYEEGKDPGGGGREMQQWLETVIKTKHRMAVVDEEPKIDILTLPAHCEKPGDIGQKFLRLWATRNISAVVTVASAPVVQALLDITQLLGCQLVEVVPRRAMARRSKRANHFLVPHFMQTNIEQSVSLMRQLNWTSLVIKSAPDPKPVDKMDEKVFTRSAHEEGICILPDFQDRDIPSVMIQDSWSLDGIAHPFPRTQFVISSTIRSEVVMTEMGHPSELDLLALEPRLSRWTELAREFLSVCNSSHLWDEDLVETCSRVEHLKNMSSVTKQNLETFSLGLTFAISLSKLRVLNSTCNVMSALSSECFEHLKTLDSSLKIDEEDKMIRFRNPSNQLRRFIIRDEQVQPEIVYDDVSIVPRSILADANLVNKDCLNYCKFCHSCVTEQKSHTQVITTGEASFYVIGFFPLHSPSEAGECSFPNVEGYAESVAFLQSFQTHAMEQKSSEDRKINIGGAVFDSCASPRRVSAIIHELTSCTASFDQGEPKIFQPESILAYVNPADVPHPQRTSDTTNLYVNNAGFSSQDNLHAMFIDSIAVALRRLEWTVVNVIVTPRSPFTTMAEYIRKSQDANGPCFFTTTVVNSYHSIIDLMNQISVGIKKSPVFLLLVDAEDASLVLEAMSMYSLKNADIKFQLIFTPWNADLRHDGSVRRITSTNIVFLPSLVTGQNLMTNALLNSISTFESRWSNEFKTMPDFISLLKTSRIGVQLVTSLMTQFLSKTDSSFLHNNTVNMYPMEIYSTGYDVIAAYANSNVEDTIAHVDKVYTPLLTFKGPVVTECQGWCPECYACRGVAKFPGTDLHIPGDLIITGLFPLRGPGVEPFTCGPLHSSSEKSWVQIHAFLFAVESAKRRYPGLLPGIRLGALVLDTCTNSFHAAKAISDFETCSFQFGNSDARKDSANPTKNLGYITDVDMKEISDLLGFDNVSGGRDIHFINSLPTHGPIGNVAITYLARALIEVIREVNWTHAVLLVEEEVLCTSLARELISKSEDARPCFLSIIKFNRNTMWMIEDRLDEFLGLPVIIMSSKSSTITIFKTLKTINEFFWIVPTLGEDWSHIDTSNYPPGSILIDSKSKHSPDFQEFLDNLNTKFPENVSPWVQDMARAWDSCYFKSDTIRDVRATQQCLDKIPVERLNSVTSSSYSDNIRNVDAMLHRAHAKHVARCLDQSGICDGMARQLVSRSGSSSHENFTFLYQGQELEYRPDGELVEMLTVYSVQKRKLVEVGSFFKSTLRLNASSLQFYTGSGEARSAFLPSECPQPPCSCLRPFLDTGLQESLEALPSYIYRKERARFVGELWAIIVICMAGTGAFTSVLLVIYVLYKVCTKTLAKRHVGLGLLLLFSLIVLYLTVIPFVLGPSDVVCCLRNFLPGFSFALCFAVILVKLMSLQSYKGIGLGGELSTINQFLTVFFILGVQVAVGAQSWALDERTCYSKIDVTGHVKYACKFDREDFVAYLSYVMFLMLLCSLYSLAVRKERKNLGEAKLLLIACWLCLAIWIAWVLCFLIFPREYSDTIICAATLACATVVVVVVFMPKLWAVSRIKYDLSQKGAPRNGYSVDTDFLYERPYSLPGTLTSTFSSSVNKVNYPKTFSNFDSGLNY